jgi:hypothetical protein
MPNANNTVELYEDNAGAVYLHRGNETWSLGPVTADMSGQFAEDAAAWVAGDWEPNDNDGQTPTNLDGLTHIATWTPGGVIAETNDFGERIAGFGGSDYIGYVLADINEIRAFLANLDDDVERARHAGHLIEQARVLQGWLAGQRARNLARAAEHTRQVTIANRLGITEGRVSQMVTEGRKLVAQQSAP